MTGTAADFVPEITDPLGKYWDQPPREVILMDDKHAILPERHNLHEYNHTIPTGTYSGKMWLQRWKKQLFLVWYGAIEGKEILIHRREVLQ
jgi:hypothetical protein